jgi:hypothetical protein
MAIQENVYEHITWKDTMYEGYVLSLNILYVFSSVESYPMIISASEIESSILSKQRRPGRSQGSIIWVIDTFITIDTVSFSCELAYSPLAFIHVYYQVVELSNLFSNKFSTEP